MRWNRQGLIFVVAVLLGPAIVAETDRLGPHEALGQLKAGNDRFVRNASRPVSLSVNRREALAEGQHPTAMILSCADSRVPPEHVFNAGLGELFVVRAAGEVVDSSILATLEYGAEHLHIQLLVVMGHESCGAVTAAMNAEQTAKDAKTAESREPAMSPNLDYLVKAIQAARTQTPEERKDVKAMTLANVEQVINDVLTHSPRLRQLVDASRLRVVGAYYELVSGRVTFSEPVGPLVSTFKPVESR